MFNEIIIIINIYNYIVIIRQRHFLSVLMDATMTHSSKWLSLFSLKDHTYALLSTALSAFEAAFCPGSPRLSFLLSSQPGEKKLKLKFQESAWLSLRRKMHGRLSGAK